MGTSLECKTSSKQLDNYIQYRIWFELNGVKVVFNVLEIFGNGIPTIKFDEEGRIYDIEHMGEYSSISKHRLDRLYEEVKEKIAEFKKEHMQWNS